MERDLVGLILLGYLLLALPLHLALPLLPAIVLLIIAAGAKWFRVMGALQGFRALFSPRYETPSPPLLAEGNGTH